VDGLYLRGGARSPHLGTPLYELSQYLPLGESTEQVLTLGSPCSFWPVGGNFVVARAVGAAADVRIKKL